MSKTNKARDRDDRGRLKAKYTGVHSHRMNTPSWWVSMFMNRPQRYENRALCRALLRGKIDADEAVFPTGNHKPHEYYW